jgi:hypothetical protein
MAWTQFRDTTEAREQTGPRVSEVAHWSEETAANSKSFVVATDAGTKVDIEILGVRFEYTATATVGTRKVHLQVLDSGSDVIMECAMPTAADIVASATQVGEFSESYGIAAENDSIIEAPIPRVWLRDGYTLKVFDSADIEATDTCIVHIRALLWR